MTVGWPLAATFAGRLYLRIGFRDTSLIGGAVMVLAFVAGLALSQTSSLWTVAGVCFLAGVGLGLVASPTMVAVQSSVGRYASAWPPNTGAFSRSLGSAVGVGVLGAIVTAVTAGRLEHAPAALRDRLPAGADARLTLRPDVAPDVVAYVRAALAAATHDLFVVLAVVALATVAALLLMPRRSGEATGDDVGGRGRPPGGPHEHPGGERHERGARAASASPSSPARRAASAPPPPRGWPPTGSPSPCSTSTRPPATARCATIERRRRPRPRRRRRRRRRRAGRRPPSSGSPPSSGAPTVLVNNAGVIRDNLLFKMTDDDWDAVMNVHLRGAFLMTRAVQKHMVDAKYGRIVNLSSRPPRSATAARPTTPPPRPGLQGFTKTLAIELGQFGVTANAIAPGFIATDMTAPPPRGWAWPSRSS